MGLKVLPVLFRHRNRDARNGSVENVVASSNVKLYSYFQISIRDLSKRCRKIELQVPVQAMVTIDLAFGRPT